MTIVLWTTATIAEELEVSRSLVGKWQTEGLLPEPFAIAGKTPGWTDSQVKEIIKAYHEKNEPQRIRQSQEDREERMINVLQRGMV